MKPTNFPQNYSLKPYNATRKCVFMNNFPRNSLTIHNIEKCFKQGNSLMRRQIIYYYNCQSDIWLCIIKHVQIQKATSKGTVISNSEPIPDKIS
jgi:hypothetical protein